MDGLGDYYREIITESDDQPVDVTRVLRDSGADVFRVLPAGRLRGRGPVLRAVRGIDAGVAFVNALPVFIASNPAWARKFTEAGVPIVGGTTSSRRSARPSRTRVLAKLSSRIAGLSCSARTSSTSAATWTS